MPGGATTAKSDAELLTLEECAARLKLSRSRTYELWVDGSIRTCFIGRSRRCRVADLAEFIAGLPNDKQRFGC
jgi:excisionase family DNA binding protein